MRNWNGERSDRLTSPSGRFEFGEVNRSLRSPFQFAD